MHRSEYIKYHIYYIFDKIILPLLLSDLFLELISNFIPRSLCSTWYMFVSVIRSSLYAKKKVVGSVNKISLYFIADVPGFSSVLPYPEYFCHLWMIFPHKAQCAILLLDTFCLGCIPVKIQSEYRQMSYQSVQPIYWSDNHILLLIKETAWLHRAVMYAGKKKTEV